MRVSQVIGLGALTLVAGLAGPPLAPSSVARQNTMLDVIERFVPHAEKYHRASDLAVSRTDMYAASGPGVTQPRGAGNLAVAYATLLFARPERREFGGVAREALFDHMVQSLRHEACTNRLIAGAQGTWGGNEPPTARRPKPEPGTWQGALETYNWAFAAKLFWDRLDAETRNLVRTVVTGEADLLVLKPPANGRPGNTGAEDNAWNTPMVALAAVMFPEHPHAAEWKERAKLLAMNAFSRAADRQVTDMVDGRPVRDWMQTVNLKDDFTLENHGFFNPIYEVGLHYNITQAAVFYAQEHAAIPEAFSFRMQTLWERVIGPLVADDGDVVLSAGQDWVAKDYQHLGYLTALATRGGRADASVAESRALMQLARRQSARTDGAIVGLPAIGYETTLVEMVAHAWWMHRLFGPAPEPSSAQYEAARTQTAGLRELPDAGVVMARQRSAIVSMSWSKSRPMGLVVPAAAGFENDPVFSAYIPLSAIGPTEKGDVVVYPCDCRADFFSTAGKIGGRRFAMTSFSDGMTMLLDRGEGPTFQFGFERIEGLTGPRPITGEDGVHLGHLHGNWANVAGRFGLLVAGGAGIRAREVVSDDDRLPNPHTLLEGSAGTGSGNRGAAILPLAGIRQTRELSRHLAQPDVPDGWSALVARAPDQTLRIAVARWDGPPSAGLKIEDARGAPVFRRPADIQGNSSSLIWKFEKPGSTGEIVRIFLTADGPVRAQAIDDGAAGLVNAGAKPARVRVMFIGSGGRQRTAERHLGPNVKAVIRAGD